MTENQFEYDNVYRVYNTIAPHFDTSRIIVWPKVEEFIELFKPNSTILDIGCGNGKNMGHRTDCYYIGIDNCENLIQLCKSKPNCEYLISNCLQLPIEDNSMDYIMSIAVIHHLSTIDRRIESLKEISRVLKKGGQGLIYVWAFEQPKFKNETKQDVMVKWNLQKKYNKNSEQDELFHRYYHLFIENELQELISNHIDNLKIIESGNQYYNWYCIVEKI